MIADKKIREILDQHDDWVNDKRMEWQLYRNAYENKFWRDHGDVLGRGTTANGGDETEPIRVETNRVRMEIDQLIAGMFYRGMRTAVRPDDVVRDNTLEKAGTKDKPLTAGDIAQMVSKLLDRWLATKAVAGLAEQGMRMGLMYPEIGFKLGMDPKKSDHPLEQIWAAVLPPWEMVYDRKSKSRMRMRYIGHIQYMSIHEAKARYKMGADVATVRQPDVVQDGKVPSAINWDADDSYVRILEFYDLTDEFLAEGKDGKEDKRNGTMRVFLVDQSTDRNGEESGMQQLARMPVPFHDAMGNPSPPIHPMVLVPIPEFPLMGVPHIALVYENNKERNFVSTFLANGWRRDAARKTLVKKDAIDEENMEALMSPRDGEYVEVETEGTLKDIIEPVVQQPFHRSVLDYLGHLDANSSLTQITSDTSRGRALKSGHTATEILSLNDYTETSLGLLRKTFDNTAADVSGLYLRVLAAAMEEAEKDEIKIRMDGEIVTFKRAWLNERWEITLTDIASTPIAEAQRRGDFTQVNEMLIQLIQLAEGQAGPEGEAPSQATARMAQLQIDYIQQIWNLPENFSWAAISQRLDEGADPNEVADAIEGALPPEAEGALPQLPPGVDPAAVADAIDASAVPVNGAEQLPNLAPA